MFWVSSVHRLVLDSLGSVLPQILFGTMSYGRETSVAVPPDVFVCFSSHSSVSKVRRFSGNVTAAAIVVLETIVLGRQTNALSLFINYRIGRNIFKKVSGCQNSLWQRVKG